MEIKDVTFDDVLKNRKEIRDLLLEAIGRELNNHDRRIRGLTSIRMKEVKNSKIEDMLKFLNYRQRGK